MVPLPAGMLPCKRTLPTLSPSLESLTPLFHLAETVTSGCAAGAGASLLLAFVVAFFDAGASPFPQPRVNKAAVQRVQIMGCFIRSGMTLTGGEERPVSPTNLRSEPARTCVSSARCHVTCVNGTLKSTRLAQFGGKLFTLPIGMLKFLIISDMRPTF